MSEYIKREEALEIIKRTSGDYATALAEIRKIPAADVIPAKHEKWKHDTRYESWSSYFICSGCKHSAKFKYYRIPLFCPNCGAKMDLDNRILYPF